MGSATPWVMEGLAEGLKVAPEAPAGLADRVMLYSSSAKTASTDLLAFMMTVVGFASSMASPFQPVNSQPVAGVAVIDTGVMLPDGK